MIMYLKSQYELNHGNQIQSQPHGSEPLSPQNTWENKTTKREKKPCIPDKTRDPNAHPKKPRNPTKTPNQYATIQTIYHPTTPSAPTSSP